MEDESVKLDTPNEPVEEPAAPQDEPSLEEPAPEVTSEQLHATNKKLYERAKKAEAELKTLKSKPAEAKVSPQLDVEETVLLAQGMPEDLLKQLRKVAKVNETSLIKAQTDPIFVAVKEKYEKELKQKDASLGASRGSAAAKPKKDFSTPGLTREEHKAMVQNLK